MKKVALLTVQEIKFIEYLMKRDKEARILIGDESFEEIQNKLEYMRNNISHLLSLLPNK